MSMLSTTSMMSMHDGHWDERSAPQNDSATSNGAESDSDSTGASSASPSVFLWHTGERMTPTLELVNFNVCENGLCNFRDATVLGQHTALKLSPRFKDATKVCITIHVNHEKASSSPAGIAPAPLCVRKHHNDTNQAMRQKWPLRKNEMWINPQECGDTVEFKKRGWALSTWYRKVSDNRWPKFVLAATMTTTDGRAITEISPEFEVRSKEQGHKTRAARGLSSTTMKRRTPATEVRANKLRLLQADIIDRRAAIQKTAAENADMMMRFEFIRRILECQKSDTASRLLDMCNEHGHRMKKWNH